MVVTLFEVELLEAVCADDMYVDMVVLFSESRPTWSMT